MNFAFLREKMVETQIKARGITDLKVLDALLKVPRHEFVAEEDAEYAYGDGPVSIGYGQTISQPYMVALMSQLLMIKPGCTVLEIGTGSGYQSAVLSELGANVYSVERIQKLHEYAAANLKKLSVKNVSLLCGDGTEGWPEHAPYDRIILTGAIPEIPEILQSQLNKQDGIIVAPEGERMVQRIRVIRFINGEKQVTYDTSCVFVPLIGKYGFNI